MPRNRVSYQSEAAFIGPALISGHVGGLAGSYYPEPLERVISMDYSINIQRQDIVQLGKESLASRPAVPHPSVDFKVNYHLASFRNEKNFSLAFNYQIGDGGTPLHASNFTQSLTEYFMSETNRGADRKNLYIEIAEEGENVTDNQTKVKGVVGFSKCYLTHYSSTASVGDFITNSAGFMACDVQYFDTPAAPINVDMPIINFKDITGLDTKSIVFPEYSTTGTSILHPRDVVVTIERSDGGSIIHDLGTDINDAKVQDYSLDLSINREYLRGIGYRIPVDYPPVPPSIATLSLNAVIGDHSTGSLLQLVDRDEEYDVYLDIYGFPECSGTMVTDERFLKNRYIMKRTKIERINYTSSIGKNKTVQFGFATECDQDDLSKGLFLSGQVNEETV
jgi:hypothetical protein